MINWQEGGPDLVEALDFEPRDFQSTGPWATVVEMKPPAGYYRLIAGGLEFPVHEKPSWLHRTLMLTLLGWQWRDH